MYSDMSILIRFLSSSKSVSVSALAVSVLPTPVGPKKIKEPIGLFLSFNPALALKTASDTSSIALS